MYRNNTFVSECMSRCKLTTRKIVNIAKFFIFR